MLAVSRFVRIGLLCGLIALVALAASADPHAGVLAAADGAPQPANPDNRPQPLRIGAEVNADIAVRYDDPSTWHQTIRYADAQYIKIHFDTLDLAPGDTITVGDRDKRMVHVYPGSGTTTDGGRGFYALSVIGEEVEIRLNVRSEANVQRGHVGAIVDRYVRGFPQWEIEEVNGGDIGIQSTCGANDRTDASCFADSHPTEYATSEAVARLTLDNGGALCTAWRVTAANFFMTNEHCITDQADADATELWFDYERPTCGGTINTPVIAQVGTFLIDDYTLDFSLLTVDENDFPLIESFGYLNLDPRPTVLGEPLYIPQHGSGNPREFGIFSDVNTPQNCQVDHVAADGRGPDTDVGYLCDTIGGSSGSPVIASNTHGVIAIHHFGNGAAPNCSVTASGTSLNRGVRMELIWPLIQPYLGDDFTLAVDPAEVAVCAGELATANVELNVIGSFSETVSLTDDAGGAFDPAQLVPPGSSSYTLDTTGQPAGDLAVGITGTSASSTQNDTLTVRVFDGAPTAPTVDSPANGATDVSLVPLVMWTPGAQNATYDVGISRNPTFTDLHDFALGISDSSWSPATPLDPLTTYYVAVRAKNPCGGAAVSVVNSFTTRDIPPVLLIDDDDNSPDVRTTFENALAANGLDYDVWDTANSDDEPNAAYMGQYDMVVWFTGDEFGGFAGPSSASEGELGTYLDVHNGCLLLSSQDYLWDRGGAGSDVPTAFMTNYLGMAVDDSDVSQTQVTGQNPFFAGTYPLSFGFTNWSDIITPDATAELLFLGNQGDAAIYKLGNGWVTTYWGFSFTGLPLAQQNDFMGTIYQGCQLYSVTGLDPFQPR